jgi:hypothetical protein
MTAIRDIALDPGFGGFKAAEVQGDVINVKAMPSVVGVGDTDIGMLGLGGVTGRKRRRRLPHKVNFDGLEFLVGERVADFARPVERLDFLRLSNGPELRALTYATLFDLVDGGAIDLRIVVGLPVEVLQGPDARAIVKGLRGWLLGEHCFTVDSKETHLHIHSLLPMAQPVGAFLEWGLNLHGQWVRDAADFTLPVGICDLGFNTLDLFTVKQGEVSARYTSGDTLGMRRAAEALVGAVKRQYQRDLSLHEADGLLRKHVKTGPVLLAMAGGTVDVRPLVRSALDVAAGEVTSFVERTWGNGRQFARLLLTGGGCLALGQRLKQQLPHATLLHDPVTANARGLARLAQREGLRWR